jgi:hypothetical protein
MRWLRASKGYILKREYEGGLKRLLECACIFSSPKRITASQEATKHIVPLANQSPA